MYKCFQLSRCRTLHHRRYHTGWRKLPRLCCWQLTAWHAQRKRCALKTFHDFCSFPQVGAVFYLVGAYCSALETTNVEYRHDVKEWVDHGGPKPKCATEPFGTAPPASPLQLLCSLCSAQLCDIV